MPRRGRVPRRQVQPDFRYNDVLVNRLIRAVMKKGKKSVAERVCYGAFDLIKEKTKKDPLQVFHQAMENIKPNLEVRPRRVGGSTYQVPMEVRPERRISLGIRWMVQYANERGDRNMRQKLADEILDAVDNKGGAVRKKEDVHRMAAANKAFAHYRW